VIKKICIFMMLIAALYADSQRPKIGLVLSGGGARGGAHLGVIKMFEKYHIPIDMIAGTSMGAFVGGLYASGKTSDEIEQLLVTTPWDKYISVSYDRTESPFRRKQFQRDFPGNLKVGINADYEPALQAGLFSGQQMLTLLKTQTLQVNNLENFSDFPIPFIAVASDLKNGEAVYLREGDLSQSIYASIAIPGGFEPIEIDGKTLVDGGVAENLPLKAMREMGADIIVAIDISTPFANDIDSKSYLTVITQMTDILMRKNVEKDIASMRDNEILITPDLEGYTPLDSDKYPEIIAIGEESIKQEYAHLLSQLSVDETTYAQYQEKRRYKPKNHYTTIDKIDIKNSTYISNKFILKKLGVKQGETFDPKKIEAGVNRLFNTEIFDDLLYDMSLEDNETILHVNATPSWNQNGVIKAGIRFEDNFKGENDYDLRLEASLYGLNRYGAEWRSRFSMGSVGLLYTEWYQPIDMMQKYYIRPYIFYRNRTVYTSASAIGIEGSSDDILDIDVTESGGALALGANLSDDFQIETGFMAKHNDSRFDLLYLDDEERIDYKRLREEKDSRSLYVKIIYDSYDNAFFPTAGYYATVDWKQEFDSLGGELDFSQVTSSFNAAYSFGKHTIAPKLEYASSYDGASDFTSLLTLGGFGKLSGYSNNALSGDNRFLAVINYRYQLFKNNFFGSFTAPLYVGGMAELGNVWYGHGNSEIPKMIPAANVYLASDTILGPFYFAFGVAAGGEKSLYFYLGEAF
jgi:NTE family protein